MIKSTAIAGTLCSLVVNSPRRISSSAAVSRASASLGMTAAVPFACLSKPPSVNTALPMTRILPCGVVACHLDRDEHIPLAELRAAKGMCALTDHRDDTSYPCAEPCDGFH